MRAYALITQSTPITTASCYPDKAPESLKSIDYVRDTSNIEIELKRVDASKFALHLTESEYRERCKPQPTEVDGEARLIEDHTTLPKFKAADDVVDADWPL
jgi:hypothetical protein